MDEPSLMFEAQEYAHRVTQLQKGMADQGVDALLLTTPADVFYTTGFLTRFWESPARPWFVVVPIEGKPIAVIPKIGASLMARCWVDDIRTWEAPDPTNGGVALLGETLRSVVPETGIIGLPMGLETHLRMPLADYQDLCSALGSRQMRDATACIERVREIKSEAEIEKLRRICHIAGEAFDAVPDFVRAGMGLDAVFRAFQVACLKAGADWISYVAGAAGQGGYEDVISPADAQPLTAGDLLMLDTGAVAEGYFCDFDRNFAIGKPSDAVAQAHDVLWHATEEVMAAIRPGQKACDVHQMISAALSRRGAEPASGRLGHGLGLTLTEWPSLSAMDQTPLRAGMVLTIEPAVVIAPGRLMVHEENIVLRASGAELLSPRAPSSLPVIPA